MRSFTALVYPHKQQMAAWLNQWAAQFARSTPDCLATATFYPEPDARDYVDAAIRDGTRVFKAHVQVGRYEPNDPLLDTVGEPSRMPGYPSSSTAVPVRCQANTPGPSRYGVSCDAIRGCG